MSREYTKCDADGVPRLVQKIRYMLHLDLYEFILFDDRVGHYDIDLNMGLSGELVDRLKITDDFRYNYLEDYMKKNLSIFFNKN